MSWNISAGQSASGVQVVLSSSFFAHGGGVGRAGKRRPWHCPCTAQQSTRTSAVLPALQSHPNLECSEGSYSIPAKLSLLPNVYESTKANFCVLILENDPTNDKTVKVKIWV